jgi:hypothetical protein
MTKTYIECIANNRAQLHLVCDIMTVTYANSLAELMPDMPISTTAEFPFLAVSPLPRCHYFLGSLDLGMHYLWSLLYVSALLVVSGSQRPDQSREEGSEQGEVAKTRQRQLLLNRCQDSRTG